MQVNLIRRSLVRSFSFVLVALFVVSSCTAGGVPAPLANLAANETAIAQAVQATLTAVVLSPLATPAAGDMPIPAASLPLIQLPAPVPDWQTLARNPGAERGSPDAPVVLVEYSDFQCPWCGRFFTEVMPQLESMIEAGEVRLVYKHFPILGSASNVAAQVAECASQQDDFWALHDWLFANQASWKASGDVETAILDAAATLGYDRATLDTCLDDPAIFQAVSQDVQETQTLGFQGTPSFMLNGRLIPGFLPWARFQSLIEVTKAEALGNTLPEGYTLAPTPPPPDTDFAVEEFAVAGDPNAPVTIVEFSDYQCPYCQRFFQETKAQLDKTYIDTGKVRLIYKDFPLDNLHPQARAAALAAECAGAQDAYWAMHDQLFSRKDGWSEQAQAVDLFKGYAEELALNTDEFKACMDGQTYAAEVQADLEEGQRAGVTGTPTFYINGRPLVGAQPFNAFVQMIEAELNK